MSIIKCKDCGNEISDMAKFCPKCGRPNKKNDKSGITSLVFGCIAIFYSIGSCLNDLLSETHPYSAVPYVALWTVICLAFGVFSLIKNKRTIKNILGLIFGISALILAITVSLMTI